MQHSPPLCKCDISRIDFMCVSGFCALLSQMAGQALGATLPWFWLQRIRYKHSMPFLWLSSVCFCSYEDAFDSIYELNKHSTATEPTWSSCLEQAEVVIQQNHPSFLAANLHHLWCNGAWKMLAW